VLLGKDELELILLIIIVFYALWKPRIPQHDSILTGRGYTDELMRTNNPARFRNAARMDKETFRRLLDFLRTHGNCRGFKHVETDEQLLIYIHSLVGFTSTQMAERFQHSTNTISKVLHSV